MAAPRTSGRHEPRSLRHAGIADTSEARWNLPTARLYEYALRRGEGQLTETGALNVETGEHTGRSPRDKFVVRESSSEADVWWGEVNQPYAEEDFAALRRRVAGYLGRRQLFVQDLYAGADPAYRLRVRVVTETAWHALFARNLFLLPTPEERAADAAGRDPDVTVLHAPNLRLDPDRDRTRSETAIVTHFGRKLILIAGTRYAGEIKKAIFSLLQYLLPLRGVATMHCSANAGVDGGTALFFGLSGTGKTTLSTDPTRTLIGDDEHGWTDAGVFNFEGGSYAKVIDLSPAAEPDIYQASRRFGAVLENVVLDPATRAPLYDDDALTENTRAAFPLSFFERASPSGVGAHPDHIVLLTADAFGVLPPVARLTPEQAIYHYLSGYTSKLAGTERGVTTPEATFSACFGAPFLPLAPARYAALLGERIARHRPALWLVNTGWSGGPYGVGARLSIGHTRTIVRAIINGPLADVPTTLDPVFGVAVPSSCPGVPDRLLRPKATWPEPDAYDAAASALARRFAANFARVADGVDPAVARAGTHPPEE